DTTRRGRAPGRAERMPFLDTLTRAIGPEHVLTDPDLLRSYEMDWMGRRLGHSRGVVRPVSTDQVAAMLRICHDQRVAVVTQGGNTGLVGGSLPVSGEVHPSTGRLAGAPALDHAAAQV